MTETVIAIQHLKKYYGKHMGAEDVSLSVKKGEIFGFLGSNGAGKSTTIRCLLGLIKPSSGQMTLFGGRYSSLTESLRHMLLLLQLRQEKRIAVLKLIGFVRF